jgi:two-component system sensor histidine kinase KdpD
MPDRRPAPDELLDRAKREVARSSRGRLKIYLGAAPGVGKTYAMLSQAQRLARDGTDLVVGLVETHGRSETEQMLLGLDIMQRRTVDYRGTTLGDFDLDAAIARKPEIILLDELAHSNTPGMRFEKRWQDVEELLKHGISVHTTLNVQHIESLNDVIAQITTVQVRETVPDHVIDSADQIELVDLPPEALLERLRSGRVYVPENVQAAQESFFRRGNLTALRELALRRTAAWVDGQMREYKQDNGIRAIWPATERILVAVSPSPSSGRIVRAAKRMAAGLHAELLAVYVETPRSSRVTHADQEQVVQTLRLAESLGAQTLTIGGDSAANELVLLAQERNVTKIVIGKTSQSRLHDLLHGSFVGQVLRLSGDIDVYVIRGDADEPARVNRPPPSSAFLKRRSRPAHYAGAAALVAISTLVGLTLLQNLDLANIAMVYLASVVVAAMWLGRGPSALAAVLGVAAFDFFFVAPELTFAVSDVQYLITFAVMLSVGLLISNLTARLKQLAIAARDREKRTAMLYAMSRELSTARDDREVAAVAARHVHHAFDADAAILTPRSNGAMTTLEIIATAGSPDWFNDREQGVARWAFDHSKPAGSGTQTLPGSLGRFHPLTASQGKLGVLAFHPPNAASIAGSPLHLLLDTFVNQISLALERVSLIEGQNAARVEAESERLRSALLSSVSHDLRTPLATIAGAATALQTGTTLNAQTKDDLTASIVHEADRLNDLIANLVFATRLESGRIELRREWISIEEIVGIGLSRHREELRTHPFEVRVPSDLPLVRVDNAMLPQVVQNLIDNALRYTDPKTPIEIAAWTAGPNVVVKIADEGPGLSESDRTQVFKRFYRGSQSTQGKSGIGLGLTICEGIIKAHGGRIWTEQHTPHGIALLFSLPIEHPQPTIGIEPTEAMP